MTNCLSFLKGRLKGAPGQLKSFKDLLCNPLFKGLGKTEQIVCLEQFYDHPL